MADKRKNQHHDGRDDNQRATKRSKGGSGGKWQTPHQKSKLEGRAETSREIIEPGDSGIWATCAKNQERRARDELQAILSESAERIYGINVDSMPDDGDEAGDDIEASIKREMAYLANKDTSTKPFVPVQLDLACVLFFKTRSPVVPVDFVHKICEDAQAGSGHRRSKYLNRLTPMTLMARATEKGLEEVARTVLAEHFDLKKETGTSTEDTEKEGCSFAIRPTIRNHTSLKRDSVIKQIAELVGPRHKVNLTKPDKVILVEIYQTVCGMSVVGSDWEALKRFNIAELYPSRLPTKSAPVGQAETTMLGKGKTDEAEEAAKIIS
ncbi:hypothetical protein BP6252_09328 [Coleophoma cylindrospora]|uniref:THUMP domain-containing protein n=1 Tax=Coleophoma cylindrospora TaxID=1849047 RepID=A0A3D8R1L1_9HELO|nr:hypothetical protein BP6252_09328 [Coleophoma cylindrospora]